MTMNRRCSNCDHVQTITAEPGLQVYQSRHYPPTFYLEQIDGQLITTAEWPPVNDDDRCGEFTPIQLPMAQVGPNGIIS